MIRTALALSGLGGLVVAFFAVFGGMALVTGTGVIIESGLRSSITGQRLVGADVIVSAPQSLPQKEDLPVALPERAVLPASLVGELARVDGVTSATGDVSFPATPVRATVPSTGHGWPSAALAGTRLLYGRPPAAADEVVVPSSITGKTIELVAAGQRSTYRITGSVTGNDLYFSPQTAARLAGPGVDLIALRTSIPVSALRLHGPYEVRTGAAKGDAESPGTAAARGMLIALPSAISGISLITVGFVVGGGIALSINRQRRDLALLRAAGATPRQVRKLVAVQGMTAALAALVPGAAVGYLLASRFGDLLSHLGVLPAGLPLTYSPLPAVAAALLLLGVARVSAWAVSVSVSRMSAVAAVRDTRPPSQARFLAGLLFLLASLVLAFLLVFVRGALPIAGVAALVSVVGLALAGPRLVQLGTGLLVKVLPRRVSPPLWLAVSNTHGYALRTAGAVAALGMVITLGTSIVLTQTTLMRAAADESAQVLRADAVITAPAYGGIPRDLLSEVRHVPGVTAAVATGATTVIGHDLEFGDGESATSTSAMVLGPEAGTVVDLGITGGSLSGLRGASVAMSSSLARVGDQRPLVLGDGTRVKARVVATYDRDLGAGPVVLSRDLASGHTGLDTSILVRTGDRAALERLAARWPGITVGGAVSAGAGEASVQLWINVAVLAVLLGYVLVSVANRLVATTASRGAELTAIRRLGATPGQLRSMIRWEALLVALAASVAGLVLSFVPLGLLGMGLLGRPIPAGPLWLAPAAVLVVCALVWLAFDLPARRLLRHSERVI